MVRRDETSAARHVDDDDGRRARDVLADVPGYETRSRVETTSRARPDDYADSLSAVEVGRGRLALRHRGGRLATRGQRNGGQCAAERAQTRPAKGPPLMSLKP
jgi:hypothetical protein